MADQLLRDELLKSDRWLDLPNDTCRLAYIPLLLIADDFGNLEAGGKRLFRLWEPTTQVGTPENAAIVLMHLIDADLARGYTGGDREFIHLPRFRSHRSYLVRKCPPSPWCDPETSLGKHVRKISNQGHAKKVTATSQQRSSDVLLGVGVGVGVDKNRTSGAKPVDKSVAVKEVTWAEHWTAQGKALGIDPRPAESTSAYCHRVIRVAKGEKT